MREGSGQGGGRAVQQQRNLRKVEFVLCSAVLDLVGLELTVCTVTRALESGVGGVSGTVRNNSKTLMAEKPVKCWALVAHDVSTRKPQYLEGETDWKLFEYLVLQRQGKITKFVGVNILEIQNLSDFKMCLLLGRLP